jgi:hypothetical protein
MLKPRWTVLAAMILAAALSRLIPHPPNLASISAVALFGGAYFSDRRMAFAVPLAALFLSDLALGFYPHMEVGYLSFALIVCIGQWLRTKRSPARITGAALASSVLFFITSNFGVWAFSSLYPKTVEGLTACYVAAVPFFWNTVQGDLFYTTLLFGGFTLLERRFSTLRDEPSPSGVKFA